MFSLYIWHSKLHHLLKQSKIYFFTGLATDLNGSFCSSSPSSSSLQVVVMDAISQPDKYEYSSSSNLKTSASVAVERPTTQSPEHQVSWQRMWQSNQDGERERKTEVHFVHLINAAANETPGKVHTHSFASSFACSFVRSHQFTSHVMVNLIEFSIDQSIDQAQWPIVDDTTNNLSTQEI